MMGKMNDNTKISGSIYFRGTYKVANTDYKPSNWHLAIVDWTTNMNTKQKYLLYLVEEEGRVFVKPYKHFKKSEYEILFGYEPGEKIDLNRVVELKGGNYTWNIY